MNHVENMRWVGQQLSSEAEQQGIGQGSEGARYCFAAADELTRLQSEIAAMRAELTESQEKIKQLETESEEYAQLQTRCFDGGGSHASVFDEVAALRTEIIAAKDAYDGISVIEERRKESEYFSKRLQAYLANSEFVCSEQRVKIIELQAELDRLKAQQEQYPVGYFEQEYVGGPVLFYQVNYSEKDRHGVIPLYAEPPDLAAKMKGLEAKNYVAEAAVTSSHNAIENCRLYAARHRKEEWATHILRFCTESGVIGSALRDSDLLLESRISELTEQVNAATDALEMLIKESREVADDHHKPRYTRLDGAILSAINVLAKLQGAEHE